MKKKSKGGSGPLCPPKYATGSKLNKNFMEIQIYKFYASNSDFSLNCYFYLILIIKRFGLKSLKRNILLLDNLGVKEISVYAMSLDNVLSRESYQRDYLLKMFENFLMKILDEKIVYLYIFRKF